MRRVIAFYSVAFLLLVLIALGLIRLCCWDTVLKHYDCYALKSRTKRTADGGYILVWDKSNCADSIIIIGGLDPEQLWLNYKVKVRYVEDFYSDFLIVKENKTKKVIDLGFCGYKLPAEYVLQKSLSACDTVILL